MSNGPLPDNQFALQQAIVVATSTQDGTRVDPDVITGWAKKFHDFLMTAAPIAGRAAPFPYAAPFVPQPVQAPQSVQLTPEPTPEVVQ